jgi:hypothetical protein
MTTMVPDWPNGFTPVQTSGGGDSGIKQRTYKVLGTYNTLILANSMCYLDTATGSVKMCADGTAYTTLVGTAVHTLAAAETDQDIQIYLLPGTVFEAQLDDAGTASDTLIEILGSSFGIEGNATANAITGFSVGELDGSDSADAPTSTLFCTVVGLSRAIDNRLATAASATERTRVHFVVNRESMLGESVG